MTFDINHNFPNDKVIESKDSIYVDQEEDKAFNKTKNIMTCDVLLSNPDFTKGFDLHTDASDLQTGGVMSQEGKPLGFFSKKFSSALMNYTVTEKENFIYFINTITFQKHPVRT